MGPTVELLCSDDRASRQGIVTYALPSILSLFPDDIYNLLHAICKWGEHKRVHQEERERIIRGEIRELSGKLAQQIN